MWINSDIYILYEKSKFDLKGLKNNIINVKKLGKKSIFI